MRRFAFGAFCGLAALSAASPAVAQRISSAYTMLDLRRCRTLEMIPEGESVRLRCPGLAGIPLFVNEGDGRSEIDAGHDDGQWESLPGFNRLGDRVEWRLSGGRPFAIIYRLRLAAAEGAQAGSALIVEAIGHGPGAPGCRLGLVDGALADANARARLLADRSARVARCPAGPSAP
jgi:hypothetical protein